MKNMTNIILIKSHEDHLSITPNQPSPLFLP